MTRVLRQNSSAHGQSEHSQELYRSCEQSDCRHVNAVRVQIDLFTRVTNLKEVLSKPLDDVDVLVDFSVLPDCLV